MLAQDFVLRAAFSVAYAKFRLLFDLLASAAVALALWGFWVYRARALRLAPVLYLPLAHVCAGASLAGVERIFAALCKKLYRLRFLALSAHALLGPTAAVFVLFLAHIAQRIYTTSKPSVMR